MSNVLLRRTSMGNVEGYWNVVPRIKGISFPSRGKMQVDLMDGRSVIVSVSMFPSIKMLSCKERNDWYIFGNGFSFDRSDEVIHIEQILGNYGNYAHELPQNT